MNSQTKNIEKIKFFPAQIEAFKNIYENDFNIILNSRQMGVTTMLSHFLAWKMLTTSEKILFISNGASQGIRAVSLVFQIIQNAIGYEAADIFFNINNRKELKTKSNAWLITIAPTSQYYIGRNFDCAIIENCAFISKFKELYTNLIPSINKKLILTSSAGEYNYFSKILEKTNKNKTRFKKSELYWKQNPFINDIEEIKKTMEEKQFESEYEMKFFSKKTQKEKVINFRIEKKLLKKINDKLFRLSENLNEEISISSYLRNLIENDLNKKSS